MKTGKSIGKIFGTVIAVLIILTMIVLNIIFTDGRFSDYQRVTLNYLLIVCGCSIVYCFAVGEITRNYSQMDKLWSLLPIAYVWIIAVRGGLKTRLAAYALIVTVWGIRLTVNFARKGAYSLKFWSGVEDYRWAIVHNTRFFRNDIAWTAFNLFFISFYQNLLVLGICLPALACMESDAPIGISDLTAATFAICFLILETVADEYQWKFHCKKKTLLDRNDSLDALPEPFNLGFNTTGPWGYMRHPNYLGEQGIWLSLYFITIDAGVAHSGIFHWSMIGPLLLILLFMGSSTLGEAISSGKYPMYSDYMSSVYKYLPVHRYKPDEAKY